MTFTQVCVLCSLFTMHSSRPQLPLIPASPSSTCQHRTPQHDKQPPHTIKFKPCPTKPYTPMPSLLSSHLSETEALCTHILTMGREQSTHPSWHRPNTNGKFRLVALGILRVLLRIHPCLRLRLRLRVATMIIKLCLRRGRVRRVCLGRWRVWGNR